MKKLPFYLRLGFAIMGIDPYANVNAKPIDPPVDPRIKDPVQPPSQIAWVPTTSRLPELYKEVTIFTTDKETLHGWARVNEHDYIHSKDDRTINNVSHWLDLGSPYLPPVEPRIKDTVQPPSQIASKKPKMPR